MADCGASGSALDRAASAAASAVGGGNANPQIRAAASAMSSLLGNTAASASVPAGGMSMPATAPGRIALASPAAATIAPTSTAVGGRVAGAPPTTAASNHQRATQMAMTTPRIQTGAWPAAPRMRTPQQPMATHGTRLRPSSVGPYNSARHSHIAMQQAHAAQAQRHHAEMQQQQQMMQHHMMMQQQAQMQQMTMMQQQQIMHMQQQQQQQQRQRQLQGQQEAVAKDARTVAASATAGLEAATSSSRERDMDEAWRDAADADAVEDAVNVASAVNVEERPDVDRWHEGLEEEVSEALDAGELYGDDGDVARGASIEELAAAWAEAERSSEQDVRGAINAASAEEYVVGEASKRLAEESLKAQSSSTSSASMTDFMERGYRHFRDGALLDAITCFEAEIHVHPDNAVAWTMLGKCHAENDMDRNAIACLERAVDADPYQLDALLSLGVSYVNELDSERALHNLRAWVEHNPTYAGLEVRDDGYGDGTPLDDVQNLLLQALEFRPDDADAREALGVCYNVSQEYDAAVESLRTALSSRPDADDGNYQLWNKLGATLANGGRSDEALPAYHRAIKAKPRYARAWLNMAISHGNLQNYREAARCYLQTLSLNPNAVHCWSYLRIALTCLEEWDLLPLATSQDLAAFHQHFDFVEY